jgi:hypothetical protein
MSYNVLVIPEDFTKDEHILKPLVEQLLGDAGKPNAVITVCRNPNFQGITGCLKVERLRNEVVLRYPMVQLFLLMVDADGKGGRKTALERVVRELQEDLKPNQNFLAEMALQEVEILPLAGHPLAPEWKWSEIRTDPDVKNTYFQKLAERENTHQLPHQGRKKLMIAAMRNWRRICELCPEETRILSSKIKKLGP